MISPILQKYITLAQFADQFARRYTKKIIDRTDNPLEAVIVTRNYTPTYLINFASKFRNLLFLLDTPYDYGSDPLFNVSKTDNFKIEITRIKGLIYNAERLNFKIMNGEVINEQDFYYKDTDFHVANVRVEVSKQPLIDFVYQLPNFPALIIDATEFSRTFKVVSNREFVINYFGKESNDTELGLNLPILHKKMGNISLTNENTKKNVSTGGNRKEKKKKRSMALKIPEN